MGNDNIIRPFDDMDTDDQSKESSDQNLIVTNNKQDQNPSYDGEFLSSKIDDYTQKTEKHKDYQKKLLEKDDALNDVNDEKDSGVITIQGNEPEKKEVLYNINQLHQDIKTCELYKKSLENEIQEYKNCISEISNLKSVISGLKEKVFDIKEKVELLKVEKTVLIHDNCNLRELNEVITKQIDIKLKEFETKKRINESNSKVLDIIKEEINSLSKIKDSLLEETDQIKEYISSDTSYLNDLKIQMQSIESEIFNHLGEIKQTMIKK